MHHPPRPLARIAAPAAALLALLAAASGPLGATDNVPIAEVVEEITVTGERAGPGLWKLRNGDNTLYILGTLSPLPKKLEWRSREVEDVLARAQQFIPANPKVDADIGPIKATQLYLQWRKLRGNADKETLESVLTPDLFERFEALRQKYAPDNLGMLKRRPVLAAGELWLDALSRSGLTPRDNIGKSVEKLARSRRVPIVTRTLKIEDPKGTLAEVAQIPLEAEIRCMTAMLGRMETDLTAARQRAEAWSVGDVAALRSSTVSDQQEVCRSALLSGQKIASLRKEFEDGWFDMAVAALEKHPTTLAIMPIDNLLRRDGPLDRMRARGYLVEEP
jgi:uncharacterized protein YbaP (TraB family)